MVKLPQSTGLIVIDVQNGFDDPRRGRRNNPEAERNIALLIAAWRETHRPVIYIQHLSREPNSPLRPGQTGCEIKQEVRPLEQEPVITKHVNSAFIGTDLESRLRREKIDPVVIVGLTTGHCVSTTARMAGNLGFKTYVVSDATATFDHVGYDGKTYTAEQVHQISLVSIQNEFATIVPTEELLQKLDG
jgi:nicotinamidase-related amidase